MEYLAVYEFQEQLSSFHPTRLLQSPVAIVAGRDRLVDVSQLLLILESHTLFMFKLLLILESHIQVSSTLGHKFLHWQ